MGAVTLYPQAYDDGTEFCNFFYTWDIISKLLSWLLEGFLFYIYS